MATAGYYDILGACRVTYAAGVPSIAAQNGVFASVGDTALGVATLNRDTDIGGGWVGGEIVVFVTAERATFGAMTYSLTDQNTIVVRGWDAAGAAQDTDFSIEIRRYRN